MVIKMNTRTYNVPADYDKKITDYAKLSGMTKLNVIKQAVDTFLKINEKFLKENQEFLEQLTN